MKLYMSPGACSLAPHIALRELGIEFQTDKVDLGTKKTSTGADYRAINPKGYVPALQIDEGLLLTEVQVILQYLADRKPELKLAPPYGTVERYHMMEWLNYVSTEIHKGFSPMFNKKHPEEFRNAQKDIMVGKLAFLDASLAGKSFLTGETFTIADAYLFTVLRWTRAFHIDLGQWKNLGAYFERVGQRPAVKAALEAEGLR